MQAKTVTYSKVWEIGRPANCFLVLFALCNLAPSRHALYIVGTIMHRVNSSVGLELGFQLLLLPLQIVIEKTVRSATRAYARESSYCQRCDLGQLSSSVNDHAHLPGID